MTKPSIVNPTQVAIHAAIVSIMRELEAVGKDRKNQAQGYNFRGIDDVYNAVNPLMAKHGVFTVPEVLDTKREERSTKSGGSMTATFLRMRYTFFAGDGSSVAAIVEGEGMDSGDKSTNKAMAGAHKYALVQVFAIPTEDAKDSEHDSPQPSKPQPKSEPAKPQPKPEAKPQPTQGAAKPEPKTDKTKLVNEDDICPIGTKSKGKRFGDIPKTELTGAVAWAKKNAAEKYADFIKKAEEFLNDTGLPSEWSDPDKVGFGVKTTAALMEIVNHAKEIKTLDLASGKAKQHLDHAEITDQQYNIIIGSITSGREILGK